MSAAARDAAPYELVLLQCPVSAVRIPAAEQVIAIENHAGGDEDLVVAGQLASAEHGEEGMGRGHADALDEGAVHAAKMRLQAGIG